MKRKLRSKRILYIALTAFFLFTFCLIASITLFNYRSSNKVEEDSTKPSDTLYNQKEKIIDDVIIEKEGELEEIPDQKEENPNKIELSGWIPYWDEQAAINSYKKYPDVFSSLSPVWYYINADGTLTSRSQANNKTIIALCKKNNTELIPTITNPNADDLSKVLNNSTLRDKLISEIFSKVVSNNYAGIDLDFESIKATDKNSFSSFIKKLAKKLHGKNKKLTIAILWKNSTAPLAEKASPSRAAQDWIEIGKYVDEFRIMAYDYTGSSGKSGPIAPLEWIDSILKYATEKVPEETIVLGLPFYAYEWVKDKPGAKALVYNDIVNIRKSYYVDYDVYDQEFGEKKLLITENGTEKVVWYQDRKVTMDRINLALKYDINKFIFWRLGGEDTSLYKYINNLNEEKIIN